ncbi:hypothetical protein K6119_04220 [Paracrocinitomix mangrovi]|uniref:hypothetical protein n=1 Tax=Paracrocinitomix mangrovi TaxID=2862509 RepID=UPI001C8EF558|nr:hypothetical protein [Paracrocinitomix mangrovi]UKN02719.1 hypothetical protein K6119_04220 [Paracrocinitomix mangrovi]
MSKTNIILLLSIAGMFVISGFLILLGFYPRGTYETEKDQIKIKVSITENTYGFVDTEFTKKVTLEDGPEKYKFDFWSVELKFSLIKREKDGKKFWIIDDYMRGVAKVQDGTIENFSCSDCSSNESLQGNDLTTFTFDQFKWNYIENDL